MTFEEIQKIKQSTCPKFSEFAKEQLPMPGQKKRLDEILNKKITVVDYKIRRSKHREGGECLQLQFLMDDEVFILFTGSGVLIHQIESCADKIPFECTVSKVDRYYSFS